jgi:putative ATP-dependent endonuclease of OLD family
VFLAELTIKNFRSFGDPGLTLRLREGLTALVGENDSGKTAIIDALRFLLGTRDQEWLKVGDDDFHHPRGGKNPAEEIRIAARFQNLTPRDKAGFAEYLTYGTKEGDEPILHLTWTARRLGERGGRPYIATDIRSGKDGDGPTVDQNARALLAATYLRPLRDAERELSAGRGSRLSQVLQALDGADAGNPFDPATFVAEQVKDLGLLGLGDYFNKLLEGHRHVERGRTEVDAHLQRMQIHGDDLRSAISVSAGGSETVRLRQLLEKLTLGLGGGAGGLGLGSNNLLFMACELLLLSGDQEGFPLLLIEEPEAHVHAQRQLRLMRYLQDMVAKQREDGQKPQIIVTTHSPNLASEIKLDNMVMIQGARAFSLARGETKLESGDYRFLERFLDVTKANLFFARGVMIVEGDAENILLPTLARLIGKDFTTYGVSIVNVGGVGLRRYAKIFMRCDTERDGTLDVPVACLTDLDVMPDCAPELLGKVKAEEAWPPTGGRNARKWRARRDFPAGLDEKRNGIRDKGNEQAVRTFVADEWTLEYDLAHAAGNALAEEVFIAAKLAIGDDNGKAGDVPEARKEFPEVRDQAETKAADKGWDEAEVLASLVYAEFVTGSRASKAIAAQYLAQRLDEEWKTKPPDEVRQCLPRYIVEAIDHVTPNREPVRDDKPAEMAGNA